MTHSVKSSWLFLLTMLCWMSVAKAQTTDINEGWRFHRGEVEKAQDEAFSDQAWRNVDLPHDWSIEDLPPADGIIGAHDPNTPDGSDVGYVRGGVGWYRRLLTDAERPNREGGELIIEGAQQECDVWINGRHVAFQPHGYIPARIESTVARADRSSLVFIPVSVTDADGARTPEGEVPLTLHLEGTAELCAFGSANPSVVKSVCASTTTTFRGRALIILRSTGHPGKARLTVSAAGFPTVTQELAFTP